MSIGTGVLSSVNQDPACLCLSQSLSHINRSHRRSWISAAARSCCWSVTSWALSPHATPTQPLLWWCWPADSQIKLVEVHISRALFVIRPVFRWISDGGRHRSQTFTLRQSVNRADDKQSCSAMDSDWCGAGHTSICWRDVCSSRLPHQTTTVSAGADSRTHVSCKWLRKTCNYLWGRWWTSCWLFVMKQINMSIFSVVPCNLNFS